VNAGLITYLKIMITLTLEYKDDSTTKSILVVVEEELFMFSFEHATVPSGMACLVLQNPGNTPLRPSEIGPMIMTHCFKGLIILVLYCSS
jgi:hypothetical protein